MHTHAPFLKNLLSTSPPCAQVSEWKQLLSQGEAKAYFDYLWATNSLAVFSSVPGLKGQWVSKYHVQLLYAFLEELPATEGGWMLRMDKWKGTGKYPAEEVSLGSAASRMLLVEQLKTRGWVTSVPQLKGGPILQLTSAGAWVLKSLHPRCRDLDLPWRISHWAEQGLEASKEQMDRYIHAYFDRQKRYRPQGR